MQVAGKLVERSKGCDSSGVNDRLGSGLPGAMPMARSSISQLLTPIVVFAQTYVMLAVDEHAVKGKQLVVAVHSSTGMYCA
jgi:hypothetical protein